MQKIDQMLKISNKTKNDEIITTIITERKIRS